MAGVSRWNDVRVLRMCSIPLWSWVRTRLAAWEFSFPQATHKLKNSNLATLRTSWSTRPEAALDEAKIVRLQAKDSAKCLDGGSHLPPEPNFSGHDVG